MNPFEARGGPNKLVVRNRGVQPQMSKQRQAPSEMLASIIACLLKERTEQNELKVAIAALISERHRNFHMSRANPEEDWKKCTNPVCCQYGRLLEREQKEEFRITKLEIQASAGKQVMFQVTPGYVIVRACDKEEVVETPRIIIP